MALLRSRFGAGASPRPAGCDPDENVRGRDRRHWDGFPADIAHPAINRRASRWECPAWAVVLTQMRRDSNPLRIVFCRRGQVCVARLSNVSQSFGRGKACTGTRTGRFDVREQRRKWHESDRNADVLSSQTYPCGQGAGGFSQGWSADVSSGGAKAFTFGSRSPSGQTDRRDFTKTRSLHAGETAVPAGPQTGRSGGGGGGRWNAELSPLPPAASGPTAGSVGV